MAGAGFANGLAGQSGRIIGIAQSIASSVRSTIKSALSIHSPSRVMASLGSYTGEGFYDGLQSWLKPVDQLAGELANRVTGQEYEMKTGLNMTGNIDGSGVNSRLDHLSDEVRHLERADEVIVVENELVGDEIYTSVKRREARSAEKARYFNEGGV